MFRRFVLVLLAACSTPEPAAVELAPHPEIVRTKERRQLSARVVDTEGREMAGQPLTFVSDDDEIVEVRNDGTFACRRTGSTEVTARSGKLYATIPITCAIAERITVPEALVLVLGEPPQALDVKVHDGVGGLLADAPLEITSRDEAVARVEDGRLVPVAPGRTEVRLASGAAKATASVQVVEVGSLELPSPLVVAAGDGRRVPVRLLDPAGVELDVPIALASSDEKIVTTLDHQLVGHAFGVAKLHASVGATTREADVLVVERQHPRPFELPPNSLVRVPLDQPGFLLVEVTATDAGSTPLTARVEGASCEAAGPGRKLELACEITDPTTLVLHNAQRNGKPVTGTYAVIRAPRAVDDPALLKAAVRER